jgi:peptide/nickel transport system substrate-binding protein
MKAKLFVVLVAAALLLPVLTGAQPAPREVVIGTRLEPDTLNPLFSVSILTAISILATTRTFDVALDGSWRPVARGVTALPNLRDGTWKVAGNQMTLQWRLRPRRWHDGRPVTCGDYVFSHAVARNPEVGTVPSDTNLTPLIANVSCPAGSDGLVVVVVWNQRYAYANLTITEFGPLPRHVLEEVYRRSPSRLRDAPFGNEAAATIGDGAYRIMEWKKGASLTVDAVGTHPVLGTPAIKRITWRFFPDLDTLATAAAGGTVDAVTTISFGPLFARAVALERQTGGRLRAALQPGVNWEHIDFNLDHPVLKDVRVRQALAHAVDREAITARLLQSIVPVAHGYIPPGHPDYTDNIPKYPYDPGRARALLRQAGFTPGADGILRDAAGDRLSLELVTNELRTPVAQMVAQYWKELGVDTQVASFPSRVFNNLLQRRQFNAALYAWVYGPTYDCDQLYTIEGIPSEANGWQGSNFPGYRNAAMDRLCLAAPREIDPAARRRPVHESMRIFARDLPALPLYFGVRAAVARRDLAGFSLGFPCLACPLTETWNAHLWAWR